MAYKYIDPANGNDANSGADWANAWKTITGAVSASIPPGTFIRIAKSPDPTDLGVTSTWTNKSATVTLSGAVTANIDLCETAWTASANVTSTADTTSYKEGSKSAKHVIAAAFTTGLVSFFATGTLDLSAYQQVSFWIRTSVAVTAGQLQIKLCSDVAGVTAVNTINVPALPSVDKWTPFTVDTGGALGSAIKSVALYQTADFAATVYLDCIIACKDDTAADSLSLTSMISRNTGDEGWYCLDSINGVTLKLSYLAAGLPGSSSNRGYSGVTAAGVAIYKRETFKTVLVSSEQNTSTGMSMQRSGSFEDGFNTYSGGWNTATTLQDGQTFFDGSNGYGFGLYSNSYIHIKIERLSFCRYYWLYISAASHSWDISIENLTCMAHSGLYLMSSNHTVYIHNGIFCANAVLYMLEGVGNNHITIVNCDGCSGNGITIYGAGDGNYFTVTNIRNNLSYGILGFSGKHYFAAGLTIKDNGVGAFSSYYNGSKVDWCLDNPTINDSVVLNPFTTIGSFTQDAHVVLYNYGGAGITRVYGHMGSIYSDTTTRHSNNGHSWKFAVNQTASEANMPLAWDIAKVYCKANKEVTVYAWVRRDHASRITGTLRCRGGQILGVASDVTADITVGADTWEQIHIHFTPTEDGVVNISFIAHSAGYNTYNAWVDDLSWSQ